MSSLIIALSFVASFLVVVLTPIMLWPSKITYIVGLCSALIISAFNTYGFFTYSFFGVEKDLALVAVLLGFVAVLIMLCLFFQLTSISKRVASSE